MATTKEDLLGAVDKLIADLATQGEAAAAANVAASDLRDATDKLALAAKALDAARAVVAADLVSLKDIADKVADEDETT